MDEGDRRGVDRLTIPEAARRLGVSEGAVRKRVTRGTLEHHKDEDGRVYVYLDAGVDERVDEGADPTSNILISQLRDEVAYLRDENRRKDEIIMQQVMTMRQLSSAQPQEPTEAPERVGEEPQRAQPHPAAGEAQEGTERPQQRSGWLAPVDKLPLWHYVLGILLVFLAAFLSVILNDTLYYAGLPSAIVLTIVFAVAWLIPGVFGFWVGFRQRNPRLRSEIIPFGALVGFTALLGILSTSTLETGIAFSNLSIGNTIEVLTAYGGIFFLPAWLLYVSGAFIGNAWQRRRAGRISGTTPASPISRTTQGAAQQPRKDLTPAQQAMLGWGGAIISALITLVGTIITVRSGG